jgi:hypothetical protein
MDMHTHMHMHMRMDLDMELDMARDSDTDMNFNTYMSKKLRSCALNWFFLKAPALYKLFLSNASALKVSVAVKNLFQRL